MMPTEDSKPQWGASYRLIAAEKWKAKSAAMGRAATEALVEYAGPQPGMNILDLATGTGESFQVCRCRDSFDGIARKWIRGCKRGDTYCFLELAGIRGRSLGVFTVGFGAFSAPIRAGTLGQMGRGER